MDAGRREGVRGAGRVLRRPVLEPDSGRRREAERQADARREHGRQRRAAYLPDGVPRANRRRTVADH